LSTIDPGNPDAAAMAAAAVFPPSRYWIYQISRRLFLKCTRQRRDSPAISREIVREQRREGFSGSSYEINAKPETQQADQRVSSKSTFGL
jgi:hypothetical protein